MKDFNEFIEYRKPLKRIMDNLSESDGIMLEEMFYEFAKQQKSKADDLSPIINRFNEFIDGYEKNISKEKAFLSTFDPIETCDDILYELEIRRDALKKSYEYVFQNFNK